MAARKKTSSSNRGKKSTVPPTRKQPSRKKKVNESAPPRPKPSAPAAETTISTFAAKGAEQNPPGCPGQPFAPISDDYQQSYLAFPVVHHGFPISNVRGAVDSPPRHSEREPGPELCAGGKLPRPVPDHLCKLPKKGQSKSSTADKPKGKQPQSMVAKKGPAKARGRSQPKKKCSGQSKPRTPHPDPTCEDEDSFHSKPMISIPVPDHVQAMLVDDWENITKNNQLVPLPHPKQTVSQILENYLTYEKRSREEGSASMDILEEVIAGLREYFEKALSRILLYRFERHQYMEVRKLWDNGNDESSGYKSVCDVYGAEHLSRLIVTLPELLAQTNMDQQSVSRLREELGKFTVWLSRNCELCFASEYETPSQEYIDKARSF